MTAVLTVRGLVKRFGELVATNGLDFALERSELHALIGPNGAGKTTAINLLSGELAADAGSILFDGAEMRDLPAHRRAKAGLVRSYQITSVFPEATALQNVMLAILAQSGRHFSFLRDAQREAALVAPAQQALAEVGLADQQHVLVGRMSHGARRQLELAMILAMRPKVMLLDEPLAGMSGYEAAAMVDLLRSLKGKFGIVLVEHDMDAVFSLADRITVIVAGRAIATGTPRQVRDAENVRLAYLGAEGDP